MVDNGPWECAEVLSIYIYIHVYQVCLFSVWDGWNLEEVLGVCREKKRQKPFWACFWLLVLWFDLWMSKICLLLGWWGRNRCLLKCFPVFVGWFVLGDVTRRVWGFHPCPSFSSPAKVRFLLCHLPVYLQTGPTKQVPQTANNPAK